jgi:molecular chaperone Hsp33
MEGEPTPVAVTSRYVRGRDALLLTANFSEFYVDYYLHWMDLGWKLNPTLDEFLKDALAALTLHLTARPQQESIAWTVNFQQPLANLFVTGDTMSETIIGRVFTEDVREGNDNLFYSTVSRPNQPQRRSIVEIGTGDFLTIAEQYYLQSEQNAARYFRLPDDAFALLVATPGCDVPWLEALSVEAVLELEKTETLSLMETRHYRFQCGCSVQRILPAIESVAREDLDGLFNGEETLRITCPRCARRYFVSREQVEAFLVKRK